MVKDTILQDLASIFIHLIHEEWPRETQRNTLAILLQRLDALDHWHLAVALHWILTPTSSFKRKKVPHRIHARSSTNGGAKNYT